MKNFFIWAIHSHKCKPYPCGSTQNPKHYERRCWNLTVFSMEYFDKGGKIKQFEEICDFLSAFND